MVSFHNFRGNLRFVFIIGLMICRMTPGFSDKLNTKEKEDFLVRVGDYITRYEERFANIIGQEDYTQRLTRPSESLAIIQMKTRSGILLVWSEPDQAWVTFRDTYRVYDKELRQRDDRLQKLFLAGSPDLRRIADESARYNLGNVTRNFNVPALVLSFLRPDNQAGFKFKVGKPKKSDGRKLVKVEFREQQSPTLIQSKEMDLPAKGYFRAALETGAIFETYLVVGGKSRDIPQARITVQYQFNPELDLMVPVEMREKYEYPLHPYWDRIDCTATYSNFRKFSVEVEHKINPVDKDLRREKK